MTYGDASESSTSPRPFGLHAAQNSLATVTAVAPPGRFGMLTLEEKLITGFREKPPGDGARINGGFFVLSPKVFDYIQDDTTSWEQEPIERLASERQLSAYMHDGFWQPMDHLRDKLLLEELLNLGLRSMEDLGSEPERSGRAGVFCWTGHWPGSQGKLAEPHTRPIGRDRHRLFGSAAGREESLRRGAGGEARPLRDR